MFHHVRHVVLWVATQDVRCGKKLMSWISQQEQASDETQAGAVTGARVCV